MTLKVCQSHLHDIDAAVKHRGMAHLAPQSDDQARGFTARWLLGRPDEGEFYVLIIIVLEVMKRARETLPPDMTVNGGVRCPLCLAQHHEKRASVADEWINGYADTLHEIVKEAGLLRRVEVHTH